MNNGIWDSLWLISESQVKKINADSELDDDIRRFIGEEFFKETEYNADVLNDIDKLLDNIGYEWDTLAEEGYMRFRPKAVTVNEATEKYIWNKISRFSDFTNVPVQRISGGELYSMNKPEIARHVDLAVESGMYGTSMYKVMTHDEQVLRFSACCNKLAIARETEIEKENLPFGIFEISKSYRYEEKERLRLAERVRCFHLPELHILNSDIASAMAVVERAHGFIDSHISELGFNYIILCSVTAKFFRDNQEFITRLSSGLSKPIVVNVVSDEDDMCENGVQFDIEYKAITSYGGFIEIATLQLDDGSTDFSYNVKCGDTPVATIHAVLFASVERAVFSLAERAVHNKTEKGYYDLPFWLSPIQCRIITDRENDYKQAQALLNKCGVRYDIDNRKLSIEEKMLEKDMAIIPFCIIVGEEMKFFDCKRNEYINKDLFLLTMEKLVLSELAVPSYSSRFLIERYF